MVGENSHGNTNTPMYSTKYRNKTDTKMSWFNFMLNLQPDKLGSICIGIIVA